MEFLQGELKAHDCRFGIVVSQFNEFITSRLLAGTIDTLKQGGASEQALQIVKVPGAFEIPLIARRLANSGKFEVVICLGAIIRGETAHFDYICREASRGISQVALDSGVPVVFGVLTTNTADQAMERSGGECNRGADAARTAMEMATLVKQLCDHGM